MGPGEWLRAWAWASESLERPLKRGLPSHASVSSSAKGDDKGCHPSLAEIGATFW